MTSEAGRDAKTYHGRRGGRRIQLHEAGAPALAASRPQSRRSRAGGRRGRSAALSRPSRAVAGAAAGSGAGALADYELLELVLFRAIPRRDVKPLAKALIARFGSFAEAIAAEPGRLAEVEGMSAGAVAEFKIVEAAAQRFAKGAVKKRLPMGSWSEVIDYCRTAMAFEGREKFRVLFLDQKNGLIADEVQASAPSTTRRSTRAKSSSARSSCRRPRSSSCTTIPLDLHLITLDHV